MCHQTRLGVNGGNAPTSGRERRGEERRREEERRKGREKKERKKGGKRRERSIKRAAGPCEVILTFLERLHLHGLFQSSRTLLEFQQPLLLLLPSGIAARGNRFYYALYSSEVSTNGRGSVGNIL